MHRDFLLLLLVGTALTGAVLTGCDRGEFLSPVTGVVTLEGEPVPRATVIFSNDEKGVHMQAEADKTGRYVVQMANGDGLPLGNYKVSVCPPIQDHPLGPIKAPPPNVDPYADTIPRKYRDSKTSGLMLNVTEQTPAFDIEMKRD
jgi:hypothetical protein